MPIAKPEWLKIKFRDNEKKKEVEEIVKRFSLNTVCKEANCPNINECFSSLCIRYHFTEMHVL